MLYKNNKKEFSDELFKNPTAEYRAAPFWAWNTTLSKELLTEQIEYLKEMGFGGFHIHSRSGMSTEYLSDKFMTLVSACVEKAKKENMLAYLYDEDRWPSGTAGGSVTKNPENRAKYLCFTPEKADSVSPGTGRKTGEPYLLACYDVILSEHGRISSYRKIGAEDACKGEKWYAYVKTPKPSGWYNNQTYVDTMSRGATDEFIRATHERYNKFVGNEFNKTIPSIFTDEPNMPKKNTFENAFSKQEVTIAWTTDFPETFSKAYNMDITDALPELFWESEDRTPSRIRYLYHDHTCERFTEAFIDTCGKWCEKHNLIFTGHLLKESTLEKQTAELGDAMRSYRSFTIPGIDILCDNIEYATVKQAQSVSRQFGREGLMAELYGVTGWAFDFRGHKFQGDWLAALGVTLRVPHLAWVSMKGFSKRDYPASINYQSPWFREYPYVENHFARLNTVLTRGAAVSEVAVIHPLESYWLNRGPNKDTYERREQLETNFSDIIEWLLFGLIDFDFICEALLPSQCGNISDTLEIGKMHYKTVIVPSCETLRKTTLDILKKFRQNGGRVIFAGDCPTYADALESPLCREVFDACEKTAYNKKDLLTSLEDNRIIDICAQDGTRSDNLIYTLRKENDTYWLFIAHAKHMSKDFAEAEEITITVRGEFEPVLYDSVSGETRKTDFTASNGFTKIPYKLNALDSLLLKLTPCKSKSFKVPVKKEMLISSVDFRKKAAYRREEPNVYILDMAEYSLDGAPFEPLEETLRIDTKIRETLNLAKANGHDVQPWAAAAESPKHFVTMKYTIESETETDVFLAAEEAVKATLNKKNVPLEPCGYYVDRSIIKYKLPKIRKGKNELLIVMPVTTSISLENAYLLGDFNVICEGCMKRIAEKTADAGFGSITSQGMPFYGGNIHYTLDFDVPAGCSKTAIYVPHYRGALVKVLVDGKTEGRIVYNPYKLEVRNLSEGKHTLTLILFGNRSNTFSCLHNAKAAPPTAAGTGKVWFGASAWYTKGDEWEYEYALESTGILSSPVIEFYSDID